MKWLLNLLKPKEGKGIISELADNIDRFVNTPEDKKEVLKMVLDDRQSARQMYEKDSSLQKVFALFFLIIWALLLYLMLRHFVFESVKLADWQIAFINTVWGGVSMKLGTIIDFLFGGSHDNIKKKS